MRAGFCLIITNLVTASTVRTTSPIAGVWFAVYETLCSPFAQRFEHPVKCQTTECNSTDPLLLSGSRALAGGFLRETHQSGYFVAVERRSGARARSTGAVMSAGAA
jgi:hypothetical protein